MRRFTIVNIFLFIIFTLFVLLGSWGLGFSSELEVDGEVENGYRILTLQHIEDIQSFNVYRGDYIKFKLPEPVEKAEIRFPTLEQQKTVTNDIETTSYIKMKKTGTFPFEMDTIKGTITVIEYQQASYRALTAKEAQAYIQQYKPLILDVRTPGEYKAGRIENAILIPVQILQVNLKKLEDYKDRPVFVYCATGNRSTVASKIMIDSGFKQILNLRRGIKDWHKKGFPVVR